MAARALPDVRWRVLSIVGTRPEAIKMAPVVRAVELQPAIDQRILLTGQHGGLSEAFGNVPIDQLSIDVREQSVGELRELMIEAIRDYVISAPPDLVIVQGDTTSALAGAIAAKRCGVAVAHVEAGLRSYKAEPWPEESNRVRIDALADILLAPTEAAAANLAAERQVTGEIHVTGNSGIDALLQATAGTVPVADSDGRKTILVTCHRRENQSETLAKICGTLRQLVQQLPVKIVLPLHPNRHIRSAIRDELGGVEHIELLDPVEYRDMVALMRASWIFLTDSGGLQEEGPALGKPVLVMRNVTERVEAGDNVELVGTEAPAILAAVHRLLMDDVHYARMAKPSFPFGDGHAAPRIATLIEDFLAARTRIAL